MMEQENFTPESDDQYSQKVEVSIPDEDVILVIEGLNVSFGAHHVLKDINMKIKKNAVTAIIGPSGCGKSTLLRSLNLMNGLYDNCKVTGKITFKNKNILDRLGDVYNVRKNIGMVFQKPNPFPKTIYENVAFGPVIHRIKSNEESMEQRVERILKAAALWDEVKDRLKSSAIALSGGQQQRLCIARALAVEPEILLMDEPCSALDPIATNKIEDLILTLKKDYTVVIVTHNMQQAARVSDYTGFMYIGELIEFGSTRQIFENPRNHLTENYITGRFG
ncbi:MAG TPA: phosphate ABC transporter ATP-binding protein PstB [Candidatus Lokiarchaeia archaeon]|nr:phosphate ABC transporter ATP-binding protein PstB [Candidatus Lokiarchaeia archaeon]